MSLLRAENLHFGYTPARPVLRGVSAEFPAGCVTAIIGPNGAGKSTLLRALLGVVRPSDGRAMIGDRGVLSLRASERASRIAYVPQKGDIAFAFSVRAVVALGRFGDRGGGLDKKSTDAIDSAMHRMQLTDRADEPFGVLSVGQQQRATLARALAQLGPTPAGKVLLADEPVGAMDPNHALAATRVMREIAARGGAVVAVLHDLTLAGAWADRVVALAGDGRVAASGLAAEVLSADTLRSIFGVNFRIVRDDRETIAVVPRPD